MRSSKQVCHGYRQLVYPEDCARFVAKVESEKEWEAAAVNIAANAQIVDTSYRNSSRILYDNEELANEIYEKLKPYLKDVGQIEHSDIHKYTLQMSTEPPPVAEDIKGGATRFWKTGSIDGPDRRKVQPGMPLRKFVDVEPRVGRALIFEQRGMVHSGEDVKKGTKLTVRTDLMFEACLDEPVEEATE
ncbi:Oxidoreductase domain containing protein [Rhizoctonia solani]|uniref:Oxidoreductase domain containing protein n=1 Tax=Rhizoctonia solani TaxID=456999 RepID=A0A8H7IBN0_9AGAM|nr:Oxidoreductase domain containing protein [Rhizoctonia solani]